MHRLQQETNVINSRNGTVLTSGTILKLDHYEDLSTSSDALTSESDEILRFSGAVNFRQCRTIAPLPQVDIFGCSQPAVYGVQAILNILSSPLNSSPTTEISSSLVRWICLREEPIIYVNKRPFVLRDYERPYWNLKYYRGITTETLEKLETRLKQDLLEEAKKYRNNLLIHEELPTSNQKKNTVVSCWEAISENSIQTTKEIFEELTSRGYTLSYARNPLTAEEVPTPSDFDELLSSCLGFPKIVFNCQLGKRRSTNAMIVAYLLSLRKTFQEDQIAVTQALALYEAQQEAKMKETLLQPSHAQIMRGDYKIVWNLIKTLNHGQRSKLIVDFALDQCDHIVNIRETIAKYYLTAEKSRTPEDRHFATVVAYNHLIRYYYLIAFNEYLYTVPYDKITFEQYLRTRPEQAIMIEQFKTKPADSLLPAGLIQAQQESNGYKRQGQLLTFNTILKSDIFFESLPEFKENVAMTSTYAPNFRKIQVEKLNVFVSGFIQPAGIRPVLDHLDAKNKTVYYINLRDEPIVFVNHKSYVLRDLDHPFNNLQLLGVTSERIEQMEKKLKDDVLQELQLNEHKILLHDEITVQAPPQTVAGDNEETARTSSLTGELSSSYESVQANQVYTISDLIQQLQSEGYKIVYGRVPLSPFSTVQTFQFDNLLKILLETKQDSTILFNCHFGLGRSNLAMVFSYLFWKYHHWHSISVLPHNLSHSITSVVTKVATGLVHQHHVSEKAGKEVATTYSFFANPASKPYSKALITLKRLLGDGEERYIEVERAIDICKGGVNFLDIRKKIDKYVFKAESARSTIIQESYLQKAAVALKTVFQYVILSSYLVRKTAKNSTSYPVFSQWLSERAEIVALLNEIESKPSHIFKLSSGTKAAAQLAKNDDQEIIEKRSGTVLSANTILKSDHFPGCQKKGLVPSIEGAPNFRKSEDNIYGVAIPTYQGIKNVLSYLDSKQNQVIWISLREEPLLYINGRPYVLRDLDRPFSNIIQTGIDRNRLEKMEALLKKDVISEASQHGGKILLHDENEKGMYAHWEPLTSVYTPIEVYTEMASKYQVAYHRVPITDEQAPQAGDFDDILGKIFHVDHNKVHIIFNCQMGRGRTTTGVVIGCLVNHWKQKQQQTQAALLAPSPPTLQEALSSEKALLDGNYKVVLALLRVLEHAKQNKTQVDQTIDKCAVMQNLRTAIYDYKLKSTPSVRAPVKISESSSLYSLSNTSNLTAEQLDCLERGMHYLQRYFLLIVFNEYLHVQMNKSTEQLSEPFEAWLAKRNEIAFILKNIQLE